MTRIYRISYFDSNFKNTNLCKILTKSKFGNHFNQPYHYLKHLYVTITEKLKSDNYNLRIKHENFWINKLITLQPNGLNIKDEQYN